MSRLFPRALLAFGALVALTASSHAATLLTWTGTSETADVVTTGFTGSHSGRSGSNSGFGSNDTFFGGDSGTGLSGAPATAGTSFVKTGTTVTMTLTNNTGSDYNISALHWDLGARDNSVTGFTVTYLSGGLGPVSTVIDSQSSIASQGGGSLFDAYDYDYTLSDDLTDITLGDTESAIFTFAFTHTAGTGANSAIFDNIAFEGAVVPEPSSAVLLGLAGLALLLRRRR